MKNKKILTTVIGFCLLAGLVISLPEMAESTSYRAAADTTVAGDTTSYHHGHGGKHGQRDTSNCDSLGWHHGQKGQRDTSNCDSLGWHHGQKGQRDTSNCDSLGWHHGQKGQRDTSNCDSLGWHHGHYGQRDSSDCDSLGWHEGHHKSGESNGTVGISNDQSWESGQSDALPGDSRKLDKYQWQVLKNEYLKSQKLKNKAK